jgi:hypothetical protein
MYPWMMCRTVVLLVAGMGLLGVFVVYEGGDGVKELVLPWRKFRSKTAVVPF